MDRSIGRSVWGDEDEVLEAITRTLSFGEIERALQASGRGTKRRRRLPNALTFVLVVLMGFFRRTSYVNLMEKFAGTTWTAMWWPDGRPPATTSLSHARDRLGVDVFLRLFEECAGRIIDRFAGFEFHGRRVFGIDGTTAKTPDTRKNREWYGLPGASRGRAAYPQMRVATLVDVGTRVVRAVRHDAYRVGEITLAWDLLPRLAKGALVLLDRHFFAFEFLWEIATTHACDFVVRIGRNIKPKVRYRLERGDCLVDVRVPRHVRRLRPDMPKTWRMRLIAYRPKGAKETIRLLTPLCDHEAIPSAEIAALYHDRWDVETCIDELKTHQCDCATVNRAVLFRSKTPQRVEQELYGLLLAYNSVRNVMAEVAEEKGISPLRLSFTTTLERVRECMRDIVLCRRPTGLRIRLMRNAIGRVLVPRRPDRKFPRAVKIKMSAYPLKPHALAA